MLIINGNFNGIESQTLWIEHIALISKRGDAITRNKEETKEIENCRKF